MDESRGFCQIAIAEFVFGPIQCGLPAVAKVAAADGQYGFICGQHLETFVSPEKEGKRRKGVNDNGVS